MKIEYSLSLLFFLLYFLPGIFSTKYGRSDQSYFFPAQSASKRLTPKRTSPGNVVQRRSNAPKVSPKPNKKNQRQSSFSAPTTPIKAKGHHHLSPASSPTDVIPNSSLEQNPKFSSSSTPPARNRAKTDPIDHSPKRRLTLMMSPRAHNQKDFRQYSNQKNQLALWAYVLLNAKSQILVNQSIMAAEDFDHDYIDKFLVEFEKFAKALAEDAPQYDQVFNALAKFRSKRFVKFGTEKVAIRKIATDIREMQMFYSQKTDSMMESKTLIKIVLNDFICYRFNEVYLAWRTAKKGIIESALIAFEYNLEDQNSELIRNIIKFFCELKLTYTALANVWGIILIINEKRKNGLSKTADEIGKKHFSKHEKQIEELMSDLLKINKSIKDRINFTLMDKIDQLIREKDLEALFPSQQEEILAEMHKIVKAEGSECQDEHVEIIYIFNSLSCAEMEIDEMQNLLDKIDKQYRIKIDIDHVIEAGNALESIRKNFIEN